MDTEQPDLVYVMPAEYVGEAAHDSEGVLRIGQGDKVVELRLAKGANPGWWNTGTVSVYVRRMSSDLSIAEIHIAKHDGLAQEELDAQNDYGTADTLKDLDD